MHQLAVSRTIVGEYRHAGHQDHRRPCALYAASTTQWYDRARYGPFPGWKLLPGAMGAMGVARQVAWPRSSLWPVEASVPRNAQRY